MAIADTLGRFLLPVRIVQAVFALVVLITTGYVINVAFDSRFYGTSSPSQFNFLVFVAVWTILVVIFLLVATARFQRVAHPFVVLGIEALTLLFWFAGWIACAVYLTGAYCVGGPCAAARTAVVFGAFDWLLFCFTTVVAVFAVLRGGHNHGTGPKVTTTTTTA